MIFSERMRQLVAVVLDRDVDAVTRELLAQGVLHFLRVTEVDKAVAGQVEEVTPRVTEAMIAEIRRRIEGFFAMAGERRAPEVQLRIEDLKPVDLEQTNRRLDEVAASIQAVRDQQLTLQQEILKLEDIRRQLSMFSALPITGGIMGSQYSFLNVQTGTLRASLLEEFTQAMKGVPSVQMTVGQAPEGDPRVTLLLITMRRDDGALRRILEQFGWEEARLPREVATGTRDDALRELEPRLEKLRREQAGLGDRVAEVVREKRGMLEEIWENLRLNELYVRVQTYFSRTARTVLFTGWLPANRQKELEQGVRRAAAGRCYLEWHEPNDSSAGQQAPAPVRFSNPRFLAPFQMLVQNFSIPEYGTVEPTPFVAVAYLIMFGLMFGDVGHGLVLAILAILSLAAYKGRSDNVRNLLRLGVWCGGAAILTGALFGAYFGMQWLRPLWFDFHGLVAGHSAAEYRVKDIYGVLLITIYFGIAVIGLGLVLNWINLIAKGRWLRLVFDKGGLLGGWIYTGGVYIAFFYVRHDYHQLPPGLELLLFAGLPAALLFFKAPIELALHRDKPFTLTATLDFLMEWILEILEIFSGYLANTLSFMRVAGLGIAHVSLMIAFFRIAGMLRGPGGAYTLGSYLVLVFGNVLVIALEGLSAGIQSLRLNYYEFFSKYFSGTGKAYEPVSLRSKK